MSLGPNFAFTSHDTANGEKKAPTAGRGTFCAPPFSSRLQRNQRAVRLDGFPDGDVGGVRHVHARSQRVALTGRLRLQRCHIDLDHWVWRRAPRRRGNGEYQRSARWPRPPWMDGWAAHHRINAGNAYSYRTNANSRIPVIPKVTGRDSRGKGSHAASSCGTARICSPLTGRTNLVRRGRHHKFAAAIPSRNKPRWSSRGQTATA